MYIDAGVSRRDSTANAPNVGLLRGLECRHGGILGNNSLIIWQFTVAWSHTRSDRSRIAWDATEAFNFSELWVERCGHSRRNVIMVMVALIRRSAGKFGTRRTLRIGTRRGAKGVGGDSQTTVFDVGMAVSIRWRWVAEPASMQVGQSTMQGRSRDIGVGQGVHRCKILSRQIPAESTKRSPRSAARARCAVATRVHLAI